MPKEELVSINGVVTKIHGNANYEVRAENTESHIILCRPSGKMVKNKIKIIVGDKVQVELSVYDLTRGRITYRIKN